MSTTQTSLAQNFTTSSKSTLELTEKGWKTTESAQNPVRKKKINPDLADPNPKWKVNDHNFVKKAQFVPKPNPRNRAFEK